MDSDGNSDISRPATPVHTPAMRRPARRLSYNTSIAMTRAQPGANERRQSLLDIALKIEREPNLLPPPPKKRKLLEGYKVEISPGGRMLTTGSLLLDQSPHGSLRKATSPPLSIFVGAVEKVAAADVDEDDVEEMMSRGDHLQRWLQPPATPSTSRPNLSPQSSAAPLDQRVQRLGSSITNDELDEVVNQKAIIAPGSDMDSDFDDDFDIDDTIRRKERDIPNNMELDEPLRRVIEQLESVMDNSQEHMLGENRTFTWTEDFATFGGTRETFVGSPGPIREFNIAQDPFLAIWDRPIIEHIVRETNRYAEQVIQPGELPPTSRLRAWTPTNVDEMYRLFAIFIYMGLDPRSKQSEYWMTSTPLQMPKFRQLMSYNRYVLLNKFLHFSDNSDTSQDCLQNEGTYLSPKLKKLAPIIHHLNIKFESLYIPEENISIDESLTLFKGRLSWIQAIRSKAARFGIKSFELCESRTGYMYRFKIYTGKENNSSIDASTDLGGKTTKVVLDLIKGLEGKGYCLTMDNFYNSPALARHLKTLGFDCLGTLRSNRRHVPEPISKLRQNVPKGTLVARHCGDVSVLAWKDVKIVNMVSTYHDDSTTAGVRAGRDLQKPISVKDYNRTMGGIDMKDQMLSMYLMERKRCLKWYIKMFKRLLNASVLNAYIMCKHSRNSMNLDAIDHRSYRYELAGFLSTVGRQEIPQPIPTDSDKVITRLRRDIPHNPIVAHGRNAKRRRCARCGAKGVEKRVTSVCTVCDVGLCFNGVCWPEYHSLSHLNV